MQRVSLLLLQLSFLLTSKSSFFVFITQVFCSCWKVQERFFSPLFFLLIPFFLFSLSLKVPVKAFPTVQNTLSSSPHSPTTPRTKKIPFLRQKAGRRSRRRKRGRREERGNESMGQKRQNHNRNSILGGREMRKEISFSSTKDPFFRSLREMCDFSFAGEDCTVLPIFQSTDIRKTTRVSPCVQLTTVFNFAI